MNEHCNQTTVTGEGLLANGPIKIKQINNGGATSNHSLTLYNGADNTSGEQIILIRVVANESRLEQFNPPLEFDKQCYVYPSASATITIHWLPMLQE